MKVMLVGGHGPGISDAVARRFAREGFVPALVARDGERVRAAAAAIGGGARGFACDLGDPAAIVRLVAEVRAALGPIAAVHWAAYAGGAGNLLSAPVAELRQQLDVSTVGLVAAVQAALPDLESARGSVLVAGGGLSTYDPGVDAMAVNWGAMGLSVAKAAQHKTCGLLAAALAPRGVYVAEIVVGGAVKGTAFDRGQATIDARDLAERFWSLHVGRAERSVFVGG
jgi:NAD(P)-dependent dehydrogenase (short-subunit alcohol dehydrogenase family)